MTNRQIEKGIESKNIYTSKADIEKKKCTECEDLLSKY